MNLYYPSMIVLTMTIMSLYYPSVIVLSVLLGQGLACVVFGGLIVLALRHLISDRRPRSQ